MMLTAAMWGLIVAQGVALAVLGRRLLRGRTRPAAVAPLVSGIDDTSVSVVVPARNEAGRIGPCLAGLAAQGEPMTEAIIVDGASTDATPEMIDAASSADARIRRLPEPPKPAGAVGRPWAIAAGCARARGEWILIVDADTTPHRGMTAAVVATARRYEYDVVSFAPRIVAPSHGARWLQAAFLTTLVYRFGAPGPAPIGPGRAMANGQCLLVRRAVLERAGGYGPATDSYCDDIRIVRHLAERGARVGFLDGRRLFDVTMYESGAETWRAWPRSLNMRDATSPRWRALDGIFLALTMVLPVPLCAIAAVLAVTGALASASPALAALLTINGLLLLIRVLLLAALRPSFASGGLAFWLSPLADPAAALRVIETTIQRPKEWRGALPAASTA